jgi:Tfp pilus assembly protein PilZ
MPFSEFGKIFQKEIKYKVSADLFLLVNLLSSFKKGNFPISSYLSPQNYILNFLT